MKTFERLCREFVAVYRHRDSTVPKIKERVRRVLASPAHQDKWALLGTGYYSEAWAHEDYPTLVLKISGPIGWGHGPSTDTPYPVARAIRNWGELRPDAWPVFAEHCLNNPHPHLPTIYLVERLSENMAWGITKRYKPVYCLGLGHSSAARGKVERDVKRVQDILKGKVRAGQHEAWLWPLRQMAHGLNITVDLHSNNYMIDPDTGDWVITDPFSTTGDGTYGEGMSAYAYTYED